MFEGFPAHWSTLKKLIWLKASALAGAVYETVTGAIASFTTLRAAPLQSLIVNIDPVQSGSGDPAPDNVRPITGHSAVNVWRTGKNLVNVSDNSGTVTNYYFREIALGFAPIAGVEYTISLDVTSTVTPFNFTVGVGVNSYAADIKQTVGWENGRVYATFTPTATQLENRPNLFIRCPRYGTQQTFDWTIKNVQLEYGSPASDYAPYTGQTIPITIPTPPGTVYGGTLNVTTGVLTVTMANIASYAGESINEPWLSSMDKYVSGATPTTGAQVVYSLATPLSYQLTPEEVTVLLGENNVWADTGDVTVTYRSN